jgi:hypothetical protein
MDMSVKYIQTGWNVRTSDGHDLGKVVDLSHDSVFLMDGDGHRHTVPKAYIDEEDEGAMLAILSIDSEALEEDASS